MTRQRWAVIWLWCTGVLTGAEGPHWSPVDTCREAELPERRKYWVAYGDGRPIEVTYVESPTVRP